MLEIIKNEAKEKYGDDRYELVHTYNNTQIPPGWEKVIFFRFIEDFEILDWYGVILEAQRVACADSSLVNFIEVVSEFKEVEKYYLGTEEECFFPWMRNILLNNWHNSSGGDISYFPHNLEEC